MAHYHGLLAIDCIVGIAMNVYILLLCIVFCNFIVNVQLSTVCVCALLRKEARAYQTSCCRPGDDEWKM